MHSWVRYSVSAYLGLLLAGSIATPGPASHLEHTPVTSIREVPEGTTWYIVPGEVKPSEQSARSSASAES